MFDKQRHAALLYHSLISILNYWSLDNLTDNAVFHI